MSRDLVLFGFHSVTARLRQAPESISQIYLDDQREDPRARDLARRATAAGVSLTMVPARRLDGMAAGRKHQGVVAMASASLPTLDLPQLIERLGDESEPAMLLLLDGVTDPRNLGACLRVADGAGAQAVIAPRDHSCGLTEVAIHTSSGAAESLPYLQVTNLTRAIEDLQIAGVRVVGTSDAAPESLYEVDLSGPIAWVLGAEDKGMRRLVRESCDALVSIPMSGRVESLNVSVAAGVVLYETRRQRIAG